MINRLSFLLILLFCLTVITVKFSFKSKIKKTTATSSHINTIVEGMEEKQFNDLGELVYVISTHYVYHDNEAKRDYYDAPEVYYYQKDQHSPWKLTADSGYTDSKREKFYFENHVYISQKIESTQSHTLIKTNFLEYDPKANIAETNTPITFQQNNTEIKSEGASINFKTHFVKLFSEAEGFYE